MASFRQSLRLVPDDSFGSMLRTRRFADGLSQAELGAKLGVRQQTIGAWERGERPQARFLPVLAEYLGLVDEQTLRNLLDSDDQTDASAEAPEFTHTMVRAVEALAALTESFAERMQAGPALTEDESTILRDAVAALKRVTAR